jgi:hypothetical protein
MHFLHRHRLLVVRYLPQQLYRINVVLVQHSQWNTYVRQAIEFNALCLPHCCGCAHPIIVFNLCFSPHIIGLQYQSSSFILHSISSASGLSKEQWKKMKEDEKKKKQGKNLGVVGITSFKSRSFAEWQASGGKNLFPVDPNSVKNKKDIPYMQRPGGSADDGDLKKNNSFLSKLAPKKKAVEPPPAPPKTNWWTL